MSGVIRINKFFMSTANHTAKTQSGLLFSDFDTVIDGKQVSLYQLTNRNGAEICITNYGGIVVSLLVPDSDGTMTDVSSDTVRSTATYIRLKNFSEP